MYMTITRPMEQMNWQETQGQLYVMNISREKEMLFDVCFGK